MEIDVARLLHEYRPALAGRLPHFAVAALRRLLHEREINDLLSRYGGLPPQRFLSAVLDDMRIGRCVWFEGGIRPDGRYLFASNHPFGGLDGMAVAEVLAETFGDVRVDGRLSDRFYRAASLRRALGIGMRLEALLLVDEMFRQRGTTVRIACRGGFLRPDST